MEKRHKDIMRVLIRKLRYVLIGTPSEAGVLPGSLDRELERIGIASDGTITPADALLNDIHNGELRAYGVAAAILTPLPRAQRAEARREMIERAAYTWINRLLALRAMEVRQLIDSTLRGEKDYEGLPEKLYFLRLENPERIASADGGWWAVIEDACHAQAEALPGLFALNDPSAALRPSSRALIDCIELVNGSQPIEAGITLEDLDAMFADPDAIGWAYQFYQEEAKARVDAKCKMGGKVVSRSELAAKTELFTEPYMVQWLLQNSLGRSYHEANPQSSLPATWEYYVQPEKLEIAAPFDLDSLTLLDPCVGSGHFLRVAFDMFVAMYRERYPSFTAREIADRILSQHLFGIDLDPRAAQLAGLTLYLRAWELVREEHRKARKRGSSAYIPPAMNLATTPKGLDKGALERHLQRAPQDRIFEKLLENIFIGLEQADTLGSLLRTREYLDNAIADLLKPRNYELEFDPDTVMRHQAIMTMAKINPAGLRNELLETIANSFKVEAGNTDDVSMALFGYEAERGVRLLQILDRQYTVVVTNPPYLGSKNMSILLKNYVEKYHNPGKRDLYATFILRCLELCKPNGRVAMVTMQGWMFLRSYSGMRVKSKGNLQDESKKDKFEGLLQETSIEGITHLGRYAFSEIGNAVVAPILFTTKKARPSIEHKVWACRLTAPRPSEEQGALLLKTIRLGQAREMLFTPYQSDFLFIPEASMIYWLNPHFLKLLQQSQRLNEIAYTRQGLATADNTRFTRCFWEIPIPADKNTTLVKKRWFWHVKGGGYSKWTGLEWLAVDWQLNGARVRLFGKGRLQGTDFFFQQGLTYTMVSRGALGMRLLEDSIFDVKGSSLFLKNNNQDIMKIAALLCSHVCSYLTRTLSQSLDLPIGYLSQLPIPNNLQKFQGDGNYPLALKKHLIFNNIVERKFDPDKITYQEEKVSSILHSIEGMIEQRVCDIYSLSEKDVQIITSDTGTPVSWYPLIIGYDGIPNLPDNIDLPPFSQEVFNYLASHKHIMLSNKELSHTKSRLKAYYEAGPGAKEITQEEDERSIKEREEEEEIISGATVPIPPETFLEELSMKMELHPISIYWLLEELRAEGVRCQSEEQRHLEDCLSVIVLRLLGYLWPKQLEAGEAIPLWADKYGIIPLIPGTGKPTLTERVRERLRREDGALATQQTEALLQELTGQNLEQWLRRSFFINHVRQFKYRPIAWHLASKPVRGIKSTGNKKSKRSSVATSAGPAFECLLYYHASPKGALARIRTQYIEPLLNAERNKVERKGATSDGNVRTNEIPVEPDDSYVAIAKMRIRELEDFAERLQKIEEKGFASPELLELLAEEPLDRWSGDGYKEPASDDELLRHEEAWHVDINDGVRVNIAPLQLAGVLASDVLSKPADAKKAIADRARWRADERRWVREGKLPRCGWMDEQVEASDTWLENQTSRHTESNEAKPQQLALQQEGLEV